jgi:hypothetical protein
MSANDGMWVVATTCQGSSMIDEVAGPFWNEAEAEQIAAEMRKQTARSETIIMPIDLFEVYLLTGDYS